MLNGKPIIIIHTNGHNACSLMRGGAMEHLSKSGLTGQFEIVSSPEIIRDEYMLKHTAAVIINRVWHDGYASMVRHYDRYRRHSDYGLKVFLDYDDLLWDIDGKQSLPSYNTCPIKSVGAGKCIEEILPKIDGVFCSTRWLAGCFKYRFGIDATVLPNCLPFHLYGFNRRKVDADIMKPRVLYGGSPTHYAEGDPGDFAGPWVEYMTDAVKNDRIDLHMFGTCNWLFKDIEDKITWHNPTYAVLWPQTVREIRPDIYLAPLVDNDFNRSKSDLKFQEACAIGGAFLGSWWKDFCPYEGAHEASRVGKKCTPEKLDGIVDNLCKKDVFNSVMAHQEKYISARWMENAWNMDRWMKAVVGDLAKKS